MMEFIYGLIVGGILVSIGCWVLWLVTKEPSEPKKKPSKDEPGDVDKTLAGGQPEDSDFEIPEEDQEYIAPIITAWLKEYVPIKTMYPSNAMLIEHLGVSLGDVSQSFEGRRVASDDHQTGNTDWLEVASWAVRLYKEGTPHNSKQTLERFTMLANLSKRELSQYATRTMNQAGSKMKEKIEGKDAEEPENKDMESPDVGSPGQPYTQSEIEDMKAAERRRQNRDNDKKS